jgi:hypothetical protein
MHYSFQWTSGMGEYFCTTGFLGTWFGMNELFAYNVIELLVTSLPFGSRDEESFVACLPFLIFINLC